MKATLIRGSLKSGKTKYIIDLFYKRQSDNPVIILPSGETARFVKKSIFFRTPIQGFCGQRILTFDHLVNTIMEGYADIPKPLKHLIINDIAEQTNLKYFEPVKRFKGFHEVISRLIAELKSGEILPDVFLKGVTKKGINNKDKDIYTLYSEYQNTLHKLNAFDHEGKFWKAQEIIDGGFLGLLADCRLLLVDGFQNFSPAELKIIKSIGKHIDEILITLPLPSIEQIPEQYSPMIKTYNLLKQAFPDMAEVRLEHPVQNGPDIRMVSCPGTIREVQEIAREIKRLLIHDKRRTNEIVVIFRDLSIYKELIVEVFNNFGIPFSISEGISFLKSPLIKSLLIKWQESSEKPSRAPFAEQLIILELLARPIVAEFNNDSDIYNNFIDLLHRYSALRNTADLDSNIFYDILVDTADALDFTPNIYVSEQVSVLDAHKARGLNYPIVFIGGLIEKGFPKQISDEPIYNDAERLELRRYGVLVEQTKEKQSEELSLFYNGISAASDVLYLTYPAADNEGKEELSSYYLDEIKEIYKDKVKFKKILLSNVIPAISDVFTRDDLLARVVFNHFHNIENDTTRRLLKHFNNEQFNILLTNSAIELNRNSCWNGIITNKEILNKLNKDFGINYRFSVSQFNDYGTCPFVFFCKRILRLEPEKGLEDELLPVDEGNLYHSILREFYTNRGDVLKIANKYFELTEKSRLFKNKGLWKIKKEEIIKNLFKIIDYEKNSPPPLGIKRTPAYFEISFGMQKKEDSDKMSVEAPLIIDNIKIQGKIDRIDLTDSGLFVVIDYKTGGKSISLKDISCGTNLQLPIYVFAVKEVFNIGVDALEAYFFYIKQKKHYRASPLQHYKIAKKALKPNPDWDEYMAKTRKYVNKYAESIRNGIFNPMPNIGCPSYCEYRDICRHNGNMQNNED